MRRFVLPRGADLRLPVKIRGKDVRYLTRVLRLSEGDSITAMGESGSEGEFVLGSAEGDSLWLYPRGAERESDAPLARDKPKDMEIVLYQCLPKGAKMDLVVRMATEAGVDRIVPVLSSRSVPRPQDGKNRIERWRRIVKEARQQSGSSCDTEVSEIMPLEDVPRPGSPGEIGIFCHEAPLAERSLHEYLVAEPRIVSVLVGPEGGLSESETGSLRSNGWKSCWLGATVLRTETAALYAVAAIRTIVLERESWTLTTVSR